MSEKMRATMHNGRAGEKGVYRAGHNDRDFDTSNTEHIRGNMSGKNWTWQRYQKADPSMSFDAAERKFYEDCFGASLEAQNERHRQSRHLERVKTVDEYRTAKNTCPEETILQIGRKGNTVSPALLKKLALEQINWEIETFPNVKILDAAIHVDEEGAPHMHKRQVWTANGKDGMTVSQNRALKEMGIERPDKTKTESRWNNAKMSYTEQCRQHFMELCRNYGLDIEVEPKEVSKSGLSLLEYQRRQEQETLERLKMSKEVEKRRQLSREKELNDRERDLYARENALKASICDFEKKSGAFDREKEKALRGAKKALKQYADKRDAELEEGLKAFEREKKAFEDEKKGFQKSVDDARLDLERQKRLAKSATREELEKRMEEYENDDFGNAVNAIRDYPGLSI